jgi:hypothetical protein
LAGHGWARRGSAGHGAVRQGSRLGWARRGRARLGEAWFGKAWIMDRGAAETRKQQKPKGQKKMSENEKAELYFDGLPTSPEIGRILERFPVESLKEGAKIPRCEIAEICQCEEGSNRHNTVEGAFRRRMFRDHNIMFARRDGMLTVLDPKGRVGYAGWRQTCGVRMVKRGGKLIHATDLRRLDGETRSVAEKRMMLAAAVSQADRVKAKQLAAPDVDMANKS